MCYGCTAMLRCTTMLNVVTRGVVRHTKRHAQRTRRTRGPRPRRIVDCGAYDDVPSGTENNTPAPRSVRLRLLVLLLARAGPDEYLVRSADRCVGL